MKKQNIDEILDSDGNLIGTDDQPANNSNEIGAAGTTDHNARIGHQHFAHDFLGRFGFYMYNESEGDSAGNSVNDLIEKVAREAYSYFVDGDNNASFETLGDEMKNHYMSFGSKVVGLLNNYESKVEPTLSESEMSKIIEDVVTNKIDKSLIDKQRSDGFLGAENMKEFKSLLDKLSDKDKGDLIKHLKK